MRGDGYTFRVYVQAQHARPRLVASTTDPWAATWTHEGQTFYSATIDLVNRYVTFVEVKPSAVAS